QFRANLTADGLKRRWALLYFVLFVVILLAAGVITLAAAFAMAEPDASPSAGIAAILVATLVLIYLAIPLATLHFFAGLYRTAAAATSLGDLEFGFDAST